MVSFFVEGTPMPKGSLTAIVLPARRGRKPRAVLIEGRRKKSRREYAEWMRAVRECAIVAQGYADPIEDAAVRVGLVFHLPRPASLKKRAYPWTRPDKDKLERAVLDALTGVVYKNDAQVCDTSPSLKVYATGKTGVHITIERMV